MTDAAPVIGGAGTHGLRRIPLEGNPDLAALAARCPTRYPFLLQSTARINSLGRYEILFAFPGEHIALDPDAADPELRSRFLARLDGAFAAEPPAHVDDSSDLPFTGGWFLYLGYELAAEIEPGLTVHVDELLPRALAVRCPAALIRHLDTGSVELVVEAEADIDERQVLADIEALAEVPPADRAIEVTRIDEEHPERFLDAVRSALTHISAGDIYQANLSREWRVEAAEDIDGLDLFRTLSKTNPAPFAGLVRWGGATIVSSSPERLVRVRDGAINTRPIAGTRPRSDDRAQDRELLEELIAHPKERAEHVMLIDLERNDLGRVCKPGSVTVDEMMVVESYAHVHHIVSNVRGELRGGITPGEIIAAVFPGGTITGCPKVRCMEIINELEGSARGAYTGSIGYLNRDGSMDLNILIRTLVTRGNAASFRAGSGIVADSEPHAELAETRAKAKGLLRAFGQ